MPIKSTRQGGLIVLKDSAGNPVQGITDSQTILEAMEKASAQLPGLYYAEQPVIKFEVIADYAEEPEPEPDPDPQLEPGFFNAIDLAPETRVLSFAEWGFHDRYQRHRDHTTWIGRTATVEIGCTNYAAGGRVVPLEGEYLVMVGGVSAVFFCHMFDTITVQLDISGLAHGWHRATVTSPNADEICVPYWYFVDRGEGDVDEMPVLTMSADSVKNDAHVFYEALVPARYAPAAQPLPPRDAGQPFALGWKNIYASRLTLPTGNHLPRRVDGVLTTANNQRYRWHDFVAKLPVFQLFDGPRGVGCSQCPTHIQVDRHGGAYCTDPWRIYRVDRDGHITTRAGYRHDHDGNLELVGDWSAVPEALRGFHELWGMAFDERTTVTDPALPQIGGEDTHPTDVVQFVASSQNNTVYRLVYSRDSLSPEPVVSVFATGLSDPWDLRCRNGVLYVSERTANRISMWDIDTGASLGNLVASPGGFGVVTSERFVHTTASQDVIDQQVCVLPEGLYQLEDEPEWLYFGSAAMRAVKRINLDTLELETVWSGLWYDNNTNFYKFCISDGTVGERGTLFLSTWSNKDSGMPFVYGPAGGGRQGKALSNPLMPKVIAGAASSTVSPEIAGMYGSACGVGAGYLYVGNGSPVLLQVTAKQDGDPTVDDLALYQQGEAEWFGAGLDVLYGQAHQNPYGLETNILSEADSYYLSFAVL